MEDGADMKVPVDGDMLLSANRAYVAVSTLIVPGLTTTGQHALAFQLGRSAEAIPRLIALAFTSADRPAAIHEHLNEAVIETYEVVVRLTHCRGGPLTPADQQLCELLIAVYEGIGRRIFLLTGASEQQRGKEDTSPCASALERRTHRERFPTLGTS